jgi:uncharacterized tellurite resistance protein B-like protein
LSLLRKLFGIGDVDPQTPSSSDASTNSVARIVEAIDHLPLETARFVAAFAYVLGRVAHADEQVSDAEANQMLEIVRRLGHLPDDQAALVVDIAQNQARLFGSTEDFLVTREFTKISDRNQRIELLDCVFAVSAADDSISNVEEASIRQIAAELGFNHNEFIAARSAWNHKRDVLKDLPGM